MSRLVFRAQQHQRLILRVCELEGVVDRRKPRDLPVPVELERGVAPQLFEVTEMLWAGI